MDEITIRSATTADVEPVGRMPTGDSLAIDSDRHVGDGAHRFYERLGFEGTHVTRPRRVRQ